MAILRWSFLPIFFAMQWIKFNCTLCPIGLNCFYPRKYAKPVLCAHPNINNITDFLSTGQLGEVATTTTTTLSPTSEAAAAAECTTPPAHLTAWIAVCTALVALLVIAQLVRAGFKLRQFLKDRAFEKGMLRRHRQRMRASRRNRQPASAPTPLILPAMLAGVSLRPTGVNLTVDRADGQRRAVGAEEEPVYDEVPLDTVEQRRDEENGEEDEEEDDSDF
ncbi:hypothetical protein niasHT_009949 [Heterodera trifolii]|uniref:Uncharacterized protein n=1 Tax=Heterodera trifolii TaxID=157864 RepID=A0ABD2ITC6_9BILA